MALKPVTVSQLNDYISRVLTTDPLLGNITVVGEISNLKYHSTGHVYFSISDENSKINCFFPASYVRNLNFVLGDGMEVTINGYINVYKKGGTYTLFVRTIQVAGEGNLSVAFQLLKEKLEAEGLFAQEHKKPISTFPKKIGIVTSQTGAAVQDIMKIVKSRTNLTDMMIFPVQVQGEGAAADIAATIDMINRDFTDIDTLIVGRGGGSMEDLWAFNEEPVARAIYNSRIPVISAVGHEIDFTISDFVADRRAETPTAAAEMAVPNVRELMDRAEALRANLLRRLESKLRYEKLLTQRYLTEMQNSLRSRLTDYRHSLETYKLILEENNPRKVMDKGYAILENMDGALVASVKDLAEAGVYRIKLRDGQAVFTMKELAVFAETKEVEG